MIADCTNLAVLEVDPVVVLVVVLVVGLEADLAVALHTEG